MLIDIIEQTRRDVAAQLAAHLEESGVPKTVVARKVGIHRQKIYALLWPDKYPYITVEPRELDAISSYLKQRAA